jgi:hypothetical protein
VSRRRTTTLRRVLVTGGQSRCSWASHVHRDYCSCSCAHETCGTPVLTSADDCACKQIMRTSRGMQQWARCGSFAAWRVKEPTHERGFTRTRLLLQAATPRKTFASRTAATRTDCRRPERQNCGCRCNKCGNRRQNVAVSVSRLRGQRHSSVRAARGLEEGGGALTIRSTPSRLAVCVPWNLQLQLEHRATNKLCGV